MKTKYFEKAVELGFYKDQDYGIFGKKDNVRKYWEDISIKVPLKPVLNEILSRKQKIRILDLGCGSGEGIVLLSKTPPINAIETSKEFMINLDNIEFYLGLDISLSMIKQGKENYKNNKNIRFLQADLSEGISSEIDGNFDLYFSSYSSLSHLSKTQLKELTRQIIRKTKDTAYIVYDLFGRMSPEWPIYWDKSSNEFLPYNMSYLLDHKNIKPDEIDWYHVTFWSGKEFNEIINEVIKEENARCEVVTIKDRSIFVGRHMETGQMNYNKADIRTEVNRLFDRDYRGNVEKLKIDISFLDDYKTKFPEPFERIYNYAVVWNNVIVMLENLQNSKIYQAQLIIKSAPDNLNAELDMLRWLFENAYRFPVLDFWASILGPQIACVLRNIEMRMPQGLGCGHGLFAIVKVSKD